MAEFENSLEERLVAVLQHPLRRVLVRTIIAANGPISPSELATSVGFPVSNVSYHVSVLVESGAMRLSDTEPVRGAIKHLYNPVPQVRSSSLVKKTLGCFQASDDAWQTGGSM